MLIIVIVFVLVLIMWLFLIATFKNNYRIPHERILFFNKQLKRITTLSSFKEQIIDIDKLYHKILLEAGYVWTFWDMLKSEPSEIWNLNKIWELHKCRNKLVHDFDSLSEKELKIISMNYLKETQNLIKQFKS